MHDFDLASPGNRGENIKEGDKIMDKQLLYNPVLLSKKELKKTYTIRNDTLNELINHIKDHKLDTPSKHMMIIGSRGMGKTTLGLRVLHEIEDNPNLRKTWQPVPFMEESYEVCDAAEFWLLALKHLSRMVNDNIWSDYSKKIANLKLDSQALEAYALDALEEYCDESGKRLILFVDDVNGLFRQFKSKREVHAIRAAMIEYPRLFLLGTAHSVFVENIDHWTPLYGFFQTIELRRVDSSESREMFNVSAERAGAKIPDLDSSNAYGVIEVIRLLTDGNTRSISMAIQMLIGNSSNGSDILERVIDEHTPYFKAKVEELPTQARKVFHELAAGWCPMLAREAAVGARLGTSQTSAQIGILVDKEYVREVKLAGERRVRYELSNRLFNIYYVFRLSSSERERLRLLVGFLYNYYGSSAIRSLHFNALGEFPEKYYSFGQVKELRDILSSHVLIYGNITDKDKLSVEMLYNIRKCHGKFGELERSTKNPSVWVKFGEIMQQQERLNDAFQSYGHALELILSNSLDNSHTELKDGDLDRGLIDVGIENQELIRMIVKRTSRMNIDQLIMHHRLIYGCLNAFIGGIGIALRKDGIAENALRRALECAHVKKSNHQKGSELKAMLLSIMLGMIPMIKDLDNEELLKGVVWDGVLTLIEDLGKGRELRDHIDRCTKNSKTAGKTLRDVVFIGAMSTGMTIISDGNRDRAEDFFLWLAHEFSFVDVAWELGAELAAGQVDDKWYLSAEEFVHKALRFYPDDPRSHFIAFVVGSKLEKWTKALDHLEICLNLDSGFGRHRWFEVGDLLVRAAYAGLDGRVREIMENGSLGNELEPLWYALRHEEDLQAILLPREVVNAAKDIRSKLYGESSRKC